MPKPIEREEKPPETVAETRPSDCSTSESVSSPPKSYYISVTQSPIIHKTESCNSTENVQALKAFIPTGSAQGKFHVCKWPPQTPNVAFRTMANNQGSTIGSDQDGEKNTTGTELTTGTEKLYSPIVEDLLHNNKSLLPSFYAGKGCLSFFINLDKLQKCEWDKPLTALLQLFMDYSSGHRTLEDTAMKPFFRIQPGGQMMGQLLMTNRDSSQFLRRYACQFLQEDCSNVPITTFFNLFYECASTRQIQSIPTVAVAYLEERDPVGLPETSIQTVILQTEPPERIAQTDGTFEIKPSNQVVIERLPGATRTITPESQGACPAAKQSQRTPLQQARHQPLRQWKMPNVISADYNKRCLANFYMERESDRVASYTRWPMGPVAFAKPGFFYRKDMDRTLWFSCGGVLRNWTSEDDAMQQCSCQFPANQRLRIEVARLKTFDYHWPKHRTAATPAESTQAGFFGLDENQRWVSFHKLGHRRLPTQTLARNGFFLNDNNMAQCHSCARIVEISDAAIGPSSGNWHYAHCRYTNTRHRQVASDTPGRVSDDVRDPPGQQSSYIPPGGVRVENYRLSTFEQFPVTCPISRRSLANSGFYFTGFFDRVNCYACGRTVEQWEATDNPADFKWHNCTRIVEMSDAAGCPSSGNWHYAHCCYTNRHGEVAFDTPGQVSDDVRDPLVQQRIYIPPVYSGVPTAQSSLGLAPQSGRYGWCIDNEDKEELMSQPSLMTVSVVQTSPKDPEYSFDAIAERPMIFKEHSIIQNLAPAVDADHSDDDNPVENANAQVRRALRIIPPNNVPPDYTLYVDRLATFPVSFCQRYLCPSSDHVARNGFYCDGNKLVCAGCGARRFLKVLSIEDIHLLRIHKDHCQFRHLKLCRCGTENLDGISIDDGERCCRCGRTLYRKASSDVEPTPSNPQPGANPRAFFTLQCIVCKREIDYQQWVDTCGRCSGQICDICVNESRFHGH